MFQPFRMEFSTNKPPIAEENEKIGDVYQKLSQRDHILKRPDTYSRERVEIEETSRVCSEHCSEDVAV